MSKLISELKEEHADIIDALMRAKLLKVCSDDGQRVLMNVKDMLLEHLRKEDEDLYPVLKSAAEDDEELRGRLAEFEEEMAGVSRHAFEFFEKYSADYTGNGGSKAAPSFCERLLKILRRGDDSAEKEFTKDFEALYSTILARVRKEEDVLYAALSRLAPQK